MARKLIRMLLIISLWRCFLPLHGQETAMNWHEQILSQIDADDLGEESYEAMMEELSDLTVWSDTTYRGLMDGHLRQNLIWSSNRGLEARAGYQNQSEERQQTGKAYLGDPCHHSLRYRAQYGQHWQMGLNVEKDAGEAWRREFPGFDSWHGFVRLRRAPLGGQSSPYFSHTRSLALSDAVLGHYRLRMGCGLVLNQGFTLGKRFFAEQLLQQGSNTITPFASNAESGYMQGAAASLRYELNGRHVLTILPYFSALQIDGTLNSSQQLTALQTDGMHRTKSEESHRQAAWQLITGARLGWQTEWIDIGLHACYTQLEYDYVRRQLYYNQNYFRGRELFQTSIDYTVHALGGWLRGEVALDDRAHLASLTSLRWASTNEGWTMALLHRYYSPQYRQLHASTLHESSAMQGEQGVTLNGTAQISGHWQLQAMIDGFWFAQPQYGVKSATSAGFEGLIRLNYTLPNATPVNATLTYRLKHKAETFRHSLDGIVQYDPWTFLTSKTQLRGRIFNQKEGGQTSLGYAVAQSLTYHNEHQRRSTLLVEAQACYFNSDDYDSRLYLTERPVLYGFGLPMLYGQGVRYSVTSTIKIGPHLSVDLKYAMTNYANRLTISSGLQQISGNTQQDIWLQLRLGL